MSAKSAYQRASQHEAELTARRLNVALEVSFADDLAAQQARNVVRFVQANEQRQVAAIVMPSADIDSTSGSVVAHPVHKLARRVAARGAGWIVLNRDAELQIATLRKEFPSVPSGVVTPDQKEFGRVQGRQFRSMLPKGGRILYVVGNPTASSTRDRRAGMREIAGNGHGGFKIDEVDGLWSAAQAKEAVLKWLAWESQRGEFPDLVGCQNDAMAVGASEALALAATQHSRAALRRIPVTGGDGLPDEGRRWVDEKRLAATVIAPTTAAVAIEQLVACWDTGRPMPLVTALPVTPYPALHELAPARG